jgi:hypothetical protein
MKVRNEQFVQPGGMYAQGEQVPHGSTAHIEDEDVIVTPQAVILISFAARLSCPGT